MEPLIYRMQRPIFKLPKSSCYVYATFQTENGIFKATAFWDKRTQKFYERRGGDTINARLVSWELILED